jgi:hypothetical protein
MKQGSLFCFVTLKSTKCFMMCSWYLWKAFDEEVHQLGLRLVGTMVWKLLMIEPFFQLKWNKIEIEKIIVIWVCTWCVWFNRVYFTIFRVEMWMILVFEKNLLLEIQTICKYWVWKQKSIEPSMCSHCWSFQF